MRAGGLRKDACPGSEHVIPVTETTRIAHCPECGRALDVSPKQVPRAASTAHAFGSLGVPVPRIAWEAVLVTHSRYEGRRTS